MKRTVALLLCLLLAFCALPIASAAQNEILPVIVVPGYSSTALFRINEQGEEEQVWGVDLDEIKQTVLQNIAELGQGIGALTRGNAKRIAATVGREFVRLYGDLACNPDGSSVYPLQQYCTTAEEANTANLIEKYGDRRFQYEYEIMDTIAETVGNENIFNFNCDFRMGAIACAEQLDAFIRSIKAYTGKNKVNIFAVSHGGQVTGAYLSLYGEKGDVNHAVMTVPALGGAALACDVLGLDMHFDELELMEYIEHGMMMETDLHWLLKAQQLGFLDQILDALAPYVLQVLGYWGSIWDFVEPQLYEEMKARWLDPVESAALIEKSDRMHYELMPQYAENFKRAQAAGEKIFIIAGYGVPAVTGMQQSSDAIISTKSSTGAVVAPFGQRFADGYIQQAATGHYQVSPSMTIDASTAYLPNHTFFVEQLYHGMVFKDDYTKELLLKLLLTDEIEDVFSSAAYPQFHATTNRSHSVFAAFNKSTEGYVSAADDRLIVRNLSEKYPMQLRAITVRGADLRFMKLPNKLLLPGKSVALSFQGTLPEVSAKAMQIVIDFDLIGSATPLGERTLCFTIMNGESEPFNAAAPYMESKMPGRLEMLLGQNKTADLLLTKTGLKDLLVMLCNIWQNTIERIKAFAA